MIHVNKEVLKKQALLTGAGVALQFLGSMCLCAASVLAMREISVQIRNHLEQLAEMK